MIKNLQNKPRVFLSHSKKDKEFIHRLCKDLRSCQIEPWLDSQEIRQGQPWLDAIFESGIPTCDAILVYLTESSAESPMVKKEIDASIIEKLKESHVALFSYIFHEILRDQLRMDIQALQTPVWNKENYAEMLPRVVAEIWHSYLDSVIMSVANEEKVRRLEAELELEKLKKTGMESIFAAKENADFDYIWKQFNYDETIQFNHIKHNEDGLRTAVRYYKFSIQIQSIIPQLDCIGSPDILSDPESFFIELFGDCLPKIEEREKLNLEWKNRYVLLDKLKTYGLIKNRPGYFASFMATEKLDRFKYWLYYKGILSNEIVWEKAKAINDNA